MGLSGKVKIMLFLIIISCPHTFASAAEVEESGHADEAGAEHEHHKKNSLGLFLGVTHESGENRETIGLEYTYRVHPRWSVGGLVERAERDNHSTLVIAFVHFFATETFYLGAGVGRKDPGEERETTYRGSIGFDIEIGGGWLINPQFNVDVIENHETEEVLGVAIGREF